MKYEIPSFSTSIPDRYIVEKIYMRSTKYTLKVVVRVFVLVRVLVRVLRSTARTAGGMKYRNIQVEKRKYTPTFRCFVAASPSPQPLHGLTGGRGPGAHTATPIRGRLKLTLLTVVVFSQLQTARTTNKAGSLRPAR